MSEGKKKKKIYPTRLRAGGKASGSGWTKPPREKSRDKPDKSEGGGEQRVRQEDGKN